MEKVTIASLQQMKRDGKKSVGVVAWDTQLAAIADRAGVDFISVGDSVGVNLWGRADPLDVTLEEMLLVCKAVRRGVTRALVSCDFPYGPLQAGIDERVARGGAADERRRRGHGQARCRGGFSRRGARDRRRGLSGVRAIRHHAADRGAARHSVQLAVRARRASSAGDDRETGRAGEAAGKFGSIAAWISPTPDRWRARPW